MSVRQSNVHLAEAVYTPTEDGAQHLAAYSCCGAVVTGDHTPGVYTPDTDSTHDLSCSDCGAVVADDQAHTFENHICAVCGWVDESILMLPPEELGII